MLDHFCCCFITTKAHSGLSFPESSIGFYRLHIPTSYTAQRVLTSNHTHTAVSLNRTQYIRTVFY